MNNAFKIEKDVTLTPRGKGFTNAMRAMEIGDSVLLPKGVRAGNAHTFWRYAKIKVAARKQSDGTIRVWRIA